ncbi:MAG: hypothetical protein KAS32_20425 [Candidatus Peribacteraceae bacterium]|nr:hypothetical protein [Candidatus Peribacteraceae bacterium]
MADDNRIENRLTEDLNYRYNEFKNKTITRANFKELSKDIMAGTTNYAQHLEHDMRELSRLKKAIGDERNAIENQGNPDKVLRSSIHYHLVDLCFQYIRFCDDALSFNPVIINPLMRLVQQGSIIIEDANHSEIFVDINKAVRKGIEDNTIHLSANLKRLEDNYRQVDKEMGSDMKSLERRVMKLELKYSNGDINKINANNQQTNKKSNSGLNVDNADIKLSEYKKKIIDCTPVERNRCCVNIVNGIKRANDTGNLSDEKTESMCNELSTHTERLESIEAEKTKNDEELVKNNAFSASGSSD